MRPSWIPELVHKLHAVVVYNAAQVKKEKRSRAFPSIQLASTTVVKVKGGEISRSEGVPATSR